jgi:orotidine-5'-phosphate decarboxylase
MFRDRLRQISEAHNSLLCVGLDPYKVRTRLVAKFNEAIIESTADLSCCFKPNLAIYEGMGPEGLSALQSTLETIHQRGLPVIGDGKRGDIANCGKSYADSLFREYGFDSVTLNPYMGRDIVEPFLGPDFQDKFLFVLVKTSNPTSGEFQNLSVHGTDGEERAMYLEVARHAAGWAPLNRVGFVVGATYPSELQAIRERYADALILIPGVGTQGGELVSAVRNAVDVTGGGFVLSVSRAITFAEGEPDEINENNISRYAAAARTAAKEYRDEINAALSAVRV